MILLVTIASLKLFHFARQALRHIGVICLPLWLIVAANAAPPATLANLSDEEYARKVEESKQEALLYYPDLNDPSSIFSRANKAVGEYHLRMDPISAKNHWNYPLNTAKETASRLRFFSPLDPMFSEKIAVLATKAGKKYLEVRVTKLHRDGVSILHAGGTDFIHCNNLTDQQREKYHIRWSTEILVPDELISCVDSAIQERNNNIEVFTWTWTARFEDLVAKTSFDFEQEYYEREHELSQIYVIRLHSDLFRFRLFELAYAANEFGHREAMERIEKELITAIPEPFKAQLEILEEKVAARNVRYEKTIALLRNKRCELRRDGKSIAEGIPKRGMLGSAQLKILAPHHISIILHEQNSPSKWVFRLNLEDGEATLLPDASKSNLDGTFSFHIVN